MEMAFVRVLSDTLVLPYSNGRYVPHASGDVISIATLSDAVRRRLTAGCPTLNAALEVV